MRKELGIREDGQSVEVGNSRKGLGARGETDLYDTYRKQRSHQYHVSVEERARTLGEDGRLPICYICKKSGHIARECKNASR